MTSDATRTSDPAEAPAPRGVGRIGAARRALPENVRALGWVSLANDAASELAYPIVPLFLAATLGAPVAIIGLIEGVAEAIAIGMRLVSGWLSDRAGERRRPWIVGGYAVSTGARAMLAAAPAWGWVLGARVLDRLGKGARSTPRDALIRDSTPASMLGSSFGYHRAMDTAGAVVGPLVAILLLHYGASLRTILWIAVIPGLFALLLLRRIREAPVAHRQAARAPGVDASTLPASFWAVLGIWVVFSLGNSSDAFLILRSHDLGLGVLLVVAAYALYNVVYATCSWPLGALSDRLPRTAVLGGGVAVFALVYVGFAVAPGGWAAWPLFALYGVYVAATEGVARAWVADQLPDRAIGTAYGIFFMATAGAALVASVAAGLLWTYVSPRAPFVLGAATATASGLLLLAYAAGTSLSPRTGKLLLVGVGVSLVALTAVAVLQRDAVARFLQDTEVEPLPAALVRPCGAAPRAVDGLRPLPAGFPSPARAVYTADTDAGPTRILAGYVDEPVKAAYSDYSALFRRSAYPVARDELDPADAEIAFSGASTTGQVTLTQVCAERTLLRITLRPR